MNPDTKPAFFSSKTTQHRWLVEKGLRLPLNYQVRDPNGGMEEAREPLLHGQGLIIGFPHFSKRDGLIYGVYALSVSRGLRVPLVLPMARHQYDDYKPVMDWLAEFSEGKICPIVIDDTVLLEEYKNLTIGSGMRTYLWEAGNAIKNGGIVALSIQGGRKSSLGEPVAALSTLMEYLALHNYTNYAVHFAAIAPKRAVPPEAYEDLKGWNALTRYLVLPGNTYSFETIRQMFDLKPKEKYGQVDPWGFGNIAGLVQRSYWGKFHPNSE